MAMISIRKINLEYISMGLFSCASMVLSLLTGIFAGVNFGTVIVRALIIMALFAFIGFGIGIVLKKYVPELYELMISVFSGAGAGDEAEEHAGVSTKEDAAESGDMSAGSEHGAEQDLPKDEDGVPFQELDKEVLTHYSTGAGVTGINTKEGKLGKHLLAKEKLVKYEPKVMAQAVRTMMSNE